MLKKARLLTRLTPARRDAPFPKHGRNSAVDPRFTFHTSRFTVPGSEARTPLANFFSTLLGLHRRAISKDGAPQQRLRRNGATLLRLPRFLELYLPLTSRNIVPHRKGVLARALILIGLNESRWTEVSTKPGTGY